ncbi:hypothetical protein [Acidiphilium multivorum]|uniref:hypothetical protein n=1 Tax=Acidiphilium multivorum TaxID=62140 RepID=UPI001B8B82DD|nr:hypothetical protein [Acidiphilium multivorum]MBS3025602.1 hypothetical protein [Acidiphilium multivorum]
MFDDPSRGSIPPARGKWKSRISGWFASADAKTATVLIARASQDRARHDVHAVVAIKGSANDRREITSQRAARQDAGDLVACGGDRVNGAADRCVRAAAQSRYDSSLRWSVIAFPPVIALPYWLVPSDPRDVVPSLFWSMTETAKISVDKKTYFMIKNN